MELSVADVDKIKRTELVKALCCHMEGRCGDCPCFKSLQDNWESTLIAAAMDCRKSLFTQVLSELDSLQAQLAEKDREINGMKAELSRFRAWEDKIGSLRNCNSCGSVETCTYKPASAVQLTRLNCPLWCIPGEE